MIDSAPCRDRGSDAVGAGIAAADHDDVLALCGDGAGGCRLVFAVAGIALVLLRQEVHREMNAAEIAAEDLQVARLLGAAGQRNRVEFLDQRAERHVSPDLDPGAEFHALGLHLTDTAVDQPLLHFEVGDPVAQQATDAVGLFEQRDPMSGARQLLRAGEPRRA